MRERTAEMKIVPAASEHPAEPIIKIRDVVKTYAEGEVTSSLLALDQVSLRVDKGDLIGLVGPSGCGKSTLLNLIAGLDTFESGEIAAEGERVTGVREIGYVFQQETLLPWRNVRRNAEFALEIAGRDPQERWRVAKAWLAKLGLG